MKTPPADKIFTLIQDTSLNRTPTIMKPKDNIIRIHTT